MHDHASLRRHAQHQHGDRIKGILREHGGRSDEAQDKKMVKRAMGEHNSQLHPGKHTKLALKDGGAAEGHRGHHRLDRAARARGGKAKGSHVNVIVAPGGGGNRPVPVPVPAGGSPMPPRPPMVPPGMPPGVPPPGMAPPGGMPPGLARPPMPGGPGMPPPGMMPRRAGGRVRRAEGGRMEAAEAHGREVMDRNMTAGSNSGVGRLQKAKMKPMKAVAAGD